MTSVPPTTPMPFSDPTMNIPLILRTLAIGAALGGAFALPIAAMLTPVPRVPVERPGVVL